MVASISNYSLWSYKIDSSKRKIICPSEVVAYKQKPIERMSKVERFVVGISITIQYMLLIAIFLSIFRYSTLHAASAVDNGFTRILVDGIFDSNSTNQVYESSSSFFLRICQVVFSVALPFMSTFAIGMTTISLISSIIYLTKPDTFNEIHELNTARKSQFSNGGLFKNIKDYYNQKGIREFILSFCPDFKAYAFQDAVANNINGPASMQDFLHHMPKYVAIFTFCIVINNRAMLDFIMTGAKIGASLFERITYDYDYVEIMNNFLDEGKDYTPKFWDTKKAEGANKLTAYKVIRNKLKARVTKDDQKTTVFKTQMGVQLANDIESGAILSGVAWDKSVFSASCEYQSTYQDTSSIPNLYVIDVSNYLNSPSGSETGYIYVTINAEDKVKYNINDVVAGKTNYDSCWSVGTPSSGNVTVTFNASKLTNNDIKTLKAGDKVTKCTGKVVVTYLTNDGVNKTTSVDMSSNNGSSIKATTSVGDIKTVLSVKLENTKLTYTDASDSKSKELSSFSPPFWVSPEANSEKNKGNES